MKTIARIIIAASISFALIGSEAVAAERGRKEYNNGNRQEQPKPQQRPGNNHNSGNNKPGRPGNGNSQRPDNRPGHGNSQRPDNRPGHGNNQRPDNRPGHNHRPPQPPHGHAPHRPHMPGGWTHWRPRLHPIAHTPHGRGSRPFWACASAQALLSR